VKQGKASVLWAQSYNEQASCSIRIKGFLFIKIILIKACNYILCEDHWSLS
jgi:hypothetical protein